MILTSYLIQKRIKRAGTIKHLQLVKDKLIGNFKDEDLQPVIDNNAYHSPEDSETDQENPSNERNIVIRDLSWRSSTVSKFLFYLCCFILFNLY